MQMHGWPNVKIIHGPKAPAAGWSSRTEYREWMSPIQRIGSTPSNEDRLRCGRVLKQVGSPAATHKSGPSALARAVVERLRPVSRNLGQHLCCTLLAPVHPLSPLLHPRPHARFAAVQLLVLVVYGAYRCCSACLVVILPSPARTRPRPHTSPPPTPASPSYARLALQLAQRHALAVSNSTLAVLEHLTRHYSSLLPHLPLSSFVPARRSDRAPVPRGCQRHLIG
ncbi:hypothetical protein BDV95DRAFT_278349 [Massariosphaeria phaeospora]|uniref:Uncharacterized protein n=1 Tax=Massariosphaeria phaeospora TaxID=100035 RepID=A0A7C8IBL5_9PLEO|nr:hypothetical protein BDV95DRAFT_278349 [Massariosphaeria phaeospora]